jgi:hypothetical protein
MSLVWSTYDEKGITSRYAIRSGKYVIAKVTVRGVVRYELWYDKQFVVAFPTAEQAKQHAGELVYGKEHTQADSAIRPESTL